MTTPVKKCVYGTIKYVVMQASINDMSVPQAARHFSVNRNSIYWAARRMGVKLKQLKTKRA